MLFENTKYQIWFIVGFAICNIIFISVLHWIAIEIKSGHEIPNFDLGNIITIILGVYVAITIPMLLCDVLGKKPNNNKKNLFYYGLKSALILVVVFYDGVVLLDAIPTFFQDMSNIGSEWLWLKGIALSSMTLIIGLIFTRKRFELKINYRVE